MVSVTDIIELVVQFAVSLMIGIGLSALFLAIFFWVKKRKIIKAGRLEVSNPLSEFNKLKGGQEKNAIKRYNKKESEYPIADRELLTRYAEGKYFGKSIGGYTNESRGIEDSIIKRELSNPSDSVTSRAEPKSKRNWPSFE